MPKASRWFYSFADNIWPKQQIIVTYILTRTGPNGANMLSVLYIVHILGSMQLSCIGQDDFASTKDAFKFKLFWNFFSAPNAACWIECQCGLRLHSCTFIILCSYREHREVLFGYLVHTPNF